MRYGSPTGVAIVITLCLVPPFGLQTTSAYAQAGLIPSFDAAASAVSKPSNTYSPKNHFFVEFRARNAASYGHMYVMYGEANARHEVIRSQIAGFFPAGDSRNCENCSVYNWTIGHILPVPSELGASDGDLEEQYVLARYRVWIDETQYKRLVAYIKHRKATKGPWNAFLNNCVTFGRDVAVFLNLNVPPLLAIAPAVVLYPQTVVEMIRDANGGEKDQYPLKDASGALPADIASTLRVPSQSSAHRAAAQASASKNAAAETRRTRKSEAEKSPIFGSPSANE